MKEKIVVADDRVNCLPALLLTVHNLNHTAAGALPDYRRLISSDL